MREEVKKFLEEYEKICQKYRMGLVGCGCCGSPALVDKATITGKKQDQGTLVNNEVEVSQVWVVKNGIGLTKSFDSKDKALELVNELNNKYLEMAELK